MRDLAYVRRFGNMPDFQHPIGWDGKNFTETFKTKSLPFFTTETVDWEGRAKKIENRLIWGDNLSIMRCLKDETIDLIYIDPPFFSGRDYNCIFGDDDEIRTFSDIWDGGLPTYLAWLSARLWEMKRLLKPTGSIFVHLDWHAIHYVKIELDKIFGYQNFVNEIVWCYKDVGGKATNYFKRKHDSILFYQKGKSRGPFRQQYAPLSDSTIKRYNKYFDKNGQITYKKLKETNPGVFKKLKGAPEDLNLVWLDKNKGQPLSDWWIDISTIKRGFNESIGYETQKPEALLSRIIQATTDEGQVVADFFSGGGTTCAVAERLGRKWIGTDISKIAISVGRDRITKIHAEDVSSKKRLLGFNVESHGSYERNEIRNMTTDTYVSFILSCYEATEKKTGDMIHGFRADKAVHVAAPKAKVGVQLIEDFHAELSDRKLAGGVILAWGYSKDADQALRDIRNGNGPDIQLIQVSLVDIDSHEFKGDNIRFLNKPAAD